MSKVRFNSLCMDPNSFSFVEYCSSNLNYHCYVSVCYTLDFTSPEITVKWSILDSPYIRLHCEKFLVRMKTNLHNASSVWLKTPVALIMGGIVSCKTVSAFFLKVLTVRLSSRYWNTCSIHRFLDFLKYTFAKSVFVLQRNANWCVRCFFILPIPTLQIDSLYGPPQPASQIAEDNLWLYRKWRYQNKIFLQVHWK